MNKINELRRNTIIIALANLGSKLIAFILAPAYSYYMTVDEYGLMDIINTTVSLVLPFICFDIYEATFRFSNEKKYSREAVFSTSIAVMFPSFVVGIGGIIFSQICKINFKYINIIICITILGALNMILAQYIRGKQEMLKFALSGIVSSVGMLFSNFIFMVYLQLGIKGWLLSFLISKVVECIYLCSVSDFINTFRIRYIQINYLKEFLKFCLPLLPTTIMWWIMSLSDRYMLAVYSGTVATGIYAVANKLPSLLSVLENIFYQAWQTTAINSVYDANRDKLYSKVFNKYIQIMVMGVLGILIVSESMVLILFEKSYSEAYRYIPLLVIAVVIHALNGNLGSLYSVFKNTKGAFYSTLIGALMNIILNIFFIPKFGIMGAALTTFISYVVTLLYRFMDTKKFVRIDIDLETVIISIISIMFQLVLYYHNNIGSYLIRCCIFVGYAIHYRDTLIEIIKKA